MQLSTFSVRAVMASLVLAGSAIAPAIAQTEAPSGNNSPIINKTPLSGDSAYDYYMRLGYAAMQRDAYATAAKHFRNALYEKPRDRTATIAYWNARDGMNEGEDGAEPASAYDRYMQIGYDATEQENYQTALINFQRALEERPGDYYAQQALRNVRTYIQRGEGLGPNETVQSGPLVYVGETPYDRYMRLGYAAMQREAYRMAASHFRAALYARPQDRQATIAYWNVRDELREQRDGDQQAAESAYDRYMRRGYDATQAQNYEAALANFRQALAERPNDPYATQAVRNVKTYMKRGANARP